VSAQATLASSALAANATAHSSEAPVKSQNRYGDFENSVLRQR
jgi:hypothetical protein